MPPGLDVMRKELGKNGLFNQQCFLSFIAGIVAKLKSDMSLMKSYFSTDYFLPDECLCLINVTSRNILAVKMLMEQYFLYLL